MKDISSAKRFELDPITRQTSMANDVIRVKMNASGFSVKETVGQEARREMLEVGNQASYM